MRNVGTARSSANVLLVGLDSEAMGMVREALAAEAALPSSSVSFGDALSAVKRARPDVVIVGFHQAMEAALALAQALVKESPNTTLVALADGGAADIILAAMRVGYKEFVVLPQDASRLRAVVHDAAYAPGDDDEKGLVVTFVGAKGGVGTTLLTTHLAAEMAGIHRVIALDLDFGMGDVASMMDVTPKDTIHDLLPRADRIDERMLTGSVAVHKSKVHVLAQPNEMDKPDDVAADDVFNIINAAAKGYQYVLIDAGSYLDAAAEIAVSVSDIIVLVTTPDVVAVRDAFRRIKMLERAGVERDRLRLVVNRARKQGFISIQEIESNLGLQASASVVDDSKIVDAAVNEGKLIREVNRKTEVADNISSLVGMLTDEGDGGGGGGEESKKDSGGSKGGFFSTLFGRG